MTLLDQLLEGKPLDRSEWLSLIEERSISNEELSAIASSIRDRVYGRNVFIRGLIEFTSFCRNDCYYCGLRHGNGNAERYRLSSEEIIGTVRKGYDLGFHTFVLQGGEDPYWNDERLVLLIQGIKKEAPDAALTLSVGERSEESYRALKSAGADRYLLRHETADGTHYASLHPASMSLENRKNSLRILKKLGYQTGAGMMIGSPYSSSSTLASDMVFLSELQPEMVGIGPFIPHKGTPFRDRPSGSIELTLRMLSLVRILLPHVLLPATTALATASENGHALGFDAGANVVMPNITPRTVRSKYLLYDGKKISGDEDGDNLKALFDSIRKAGYIPDMSRGDYIPWLC